MSTLEQLKTHLQEGQVYRRNDLMKWSRSVDRHLHALLEEGVLQKLSQGVYYYPKSSAFGKTPPEEENLVRTFLKDTRFLLTSPNLYNALGVGTTQLYNQRTVYNHKRHGQFRLGNRTFDFQVKHHFPEKLTPEFLLVDLAGNLDRLAEDQHQVRNNVLSKARSMDRNKLKHALDQYGTGRAKRMLAPIFE
ncbi:hypothetical protein FHW88_000387 [Mucilaginibacter sp. SG538B]|uniref:DUF6088 family protein n=1 Tax=Mucilaginibacter sp. SG538B TaxID=2587021 RepID=UPI00159D52C9|nr:DUF6088 family protein [Mucilaginibacter sp. SG538B]NVM62111.1 hypothetical protein [Mucilaginibacter sp. SG538B]